MAIHSRYRPAYGLNVDGQSDERVVTEKATHAAARHLRDLYVRFGSWPLALAAYDAGERAVQGAIELGRSTDFWGLRSKRLLPKETRDYVPAVLAAVKLLGYPSALSRPAGAKEQNAESQAVRVVYALTAGGAIDGPNWLAARIRALRRTRVCWLGPSWARLRRAGLEMR